MQQKHQQKESKQLENPNKNKAFIYTNECSMCGGKKEHTPIVHKLQEKGLNVQVKQVKLWLGWQREATKIGIELPFVWVFDTQKGKTIKEALETGIDDICE